MARRKAPQNKAQPGAPENKELEDVVNGEDQMNESLVPDDEDDQENETDELTDLVVRDTQLRRLLKAEQNAWTGVISRAAFREIAERIRAELNGKVEFEEDPNGA